MLLKALKNSVIVVLVIAMITLATPTAFALDVTPDDSVMNVKTVQDEILLENATNDHDMDTEIIAQNAVLQDIINDPLKSVEE